MNQNPVPFDQPIYVTRPLMPDLDLVMNRLRDVWSSQWLSNGGAQHNLLEDRLRDFLKAPHLSLFNNGTIALLVAVQSLRLQGEVITTPFTFPATTHVLAWNNIKPVFCDIEPGSLTIDPDRIESLITNRTTGILGVHVYGIPCQVARIQEIANRHGLKVIYDAAHAFGTEIRGKGIGTFGDISMFSFHPTKLFHTAEGGALTYNDPHLKQRIDLLKNFGIRNEFEVLLPGINGKMNELSAVIGLTVLDLVNEERSRRAVIRAQYRRELGDVPGIEFPDQPEDATSSEQYLVVRITKDGFGKSRDEVFEYLRQYRVFARKYFYPLTSDYPCYHQLPSASADALPNAQKVAQEVLCLPFYGLLKESDVSRICDMIKAAKR
ncbi:MAG TPA: DegT/DnrJ/EryC1/StrS family aminotransferase [Nitrospira sp.]|nr:DegT/DnrJ/EryC1/StrS family aminotransferase [Nitrospira sp.]